MILEKIEHKRTGCLKSVLLCYFSFVCKSYSKIEVPLETAYS